MGPSVGKELSTRKQIQKKSWPTPRLRPRPRSRAPRPARRLPERPLKSHQKKKQNPLKVRLLLLRKLTAQKLPQKRQKLLQRVQKKLPKLQKKQLLKKRLRKRAASHVIHFLYLYFVSVLYTVSLINE